MSFKIALLVQAVFLLAQASATANAAAGSFDWPSLVKDFGIVAALVWYLWYTQSVAIPNQQRIAADRAEHMANNYRADITALVRDFRQDIAAERQARTEEFRILRDSFQCRGSQIVVPPGSGH
jgi:hypothetical protein